MYLCPDHHFDRYLLDLFAVLISTLRLFRDLTVSMNLLAEVNIKQVTDYRTSDQSLRNV